MLLSAVSSYRLDGFELIPSALYSSETTSDIICFVISFTSLLFVLPFAIVSIACVTSSTLLSTFNTLFSFCVISSSTISVSKSNIFIIVFDVGLITILIPPKDSATTPYSPSTSSANVSIP